MEILLELRNPIDFVASTSIHKLFKFMPCITLNFMIIRGINSFRGKEWCCSSRNTWRGEEKGDKEERKEERHSEL